MTLLCNNPVQSVLLVCQFTARSVRRLVLCRYPHKVVNLKVNGATMAVRVFTLTLLGGLHIRTTPFLGIVDPFYTVRSVRAGLTDDVRNVDQVRGAFPIEARTRLVSHLDHKRREASRIVW